MTFKGFPREKSNFDRLPHIMREIAPVVSANQFKILYVILWKTWGYQNYTTGEPITYAEFKDNTGIRNDTTLSNALQELEASGYIQIEKDDSDLSYKERSYRLNMEGISSTENGEHISQDNPSSSTKTVEPIIGTRKKRKTKKAKTPGYYANLSKEEKNKATELYYLVQAEGFGIPKGEKYSERTAASLRAIRDALHEDPLVTAERLTRMYRAFKRTYPNATKPMSLDGIYKWLDILAPIGDNGGSIQIAKGF